MLIEFEVGNFLSFKKPVRLSMVAVNTDKELLESNTFEIGRYRLLRSAAIYGANASGKSNLLAAMNFMAKFVINSSRESTAQDEIKVVPFKFDYETENEPSRFEMIFLIENKRYRYGFEATRKRINGEWLFVSEKIKEEPLFLRSVDGIDVRTGFEEGVGLESKTRDNALFLSVVAQFNGLISKVITLWFLELECMYGQFDQTYPESTILKMQQDDTKALLIQLVKDADLGIDDLKIERLNSMDWISKPVISSVHHKYRKDRKDGLVTLDFINEESEGTKKLFRFAGPLLDCVESGCKVCFDELDAKLHPLLTRAIVRLFNSQANRRNSQLIFTTHDTNLLQFGDLRRDQVWFTEKDQTGATDLYSLAEFKLKGGTKVRKDAAYEKNYIQGRYGAIPFLGDFGAILKKTGKNE